MQADRKRWTIWKNCILQTKTEKGRRAFLTWEQNARFHFFTAKVGIVDKSFYPEKIMRWV